MFNKDFVTVVANRVDGMVSHLPRAMLDEVLFHTLKEEFDGSLPRSVSEIVKPDLLNRRSSTETYKLLYKEGKLEFKFSDNEIHIRHRPDDKQYTDHSGFKDCYGLLSSLAKGENHDTSGTQPN